MPRTLLSKDFFARDTLTVARELIGVTMNFNGCEGRIVETEAYTTDAASHAVTRFHQAHIMRETFARIYVYLIYGMYYCLNFTADAAGPGAVLIRAIEPTRGLAQMQERRKTDDMKRLTSGPGRLCQAFDIDLRLNGAIIGRELKLTARRQEVGILSSPRIGISQATELDWRFYERDNRFVSRFTRKSPLQSE